MKLYQIEILFHIVIVVCTLTLHTFEQKSLSVSLSHTLSRRSHELECAARDDISQIYIKQKTAFAMLFLVWFSPIEWNAYIEHQQSTDRVLSSSTKFITKYLLFWHPTHKIYKKYIFIYCCCCCFFSSVLLKISFWVCFFFYCLSKSYKIV